MNRSKKTDPRMWNRWRSSGALSDFRFTPGGMLHMILPSVKAAYGRAGLDVNVSEDSRLYVQCCALSQCVSQSITNGRLAIRSIDMGHNL